MTLAELEKAVTLQLQHSANTLESLIAQNHLYGCFLVMEDICQGQLSSSAKDICQQQDNGSQRQDSVTLVSLEKNFASIGIRHGFLMDTKLMLTPLPEYQAAWLLYFQELLAVRDMDIVDKTEDALIDVIQQHAGTHDFFMKAIKTGVLPQEVVSPIVEMLLSGATEFLPALPQVATASSAVEPASSAVETTSVVKPKKSNFARTRHVMQVTIPTKKYLSKTRRALKK